MASPTSSGSEFQIEIRLTKDGELVSRLKGVQTAFTRLGTTSEEVMKKLEDRYNKAAKGSKAYYDAEISHLRTLRDTTATTIKQTREYDARIASLEKRKAKLNQAKRGSINYYKAEIKALREEQRSIAISSKRYKELETQIRKYQGTLDLATKSQGTVVKTNQDMISNAGLAGATLTEFGRTISDANYGIRGMANNLSQLSTLFITLMAKTDGAKNAFALLFAQLKGPMGVIIAFQGVIALIERFAIAEERAKSETEKMTSAFDDKAKALDLLLDKYAMLNGQTAERAKLERALSEIDSDFEKIISDVNLSEQKRNEIVQARRELVKQEIQASSEKEKASKRQIEIAERQAKIEEKLNSFTINKAGQMVSQLLGISSERDAIAARNKLLEEQIELQTESEQIDNDYINTLSELATERKNYNNVTGKTNDETAVLNRELNKDLLSQKLALENAKQASDEESSLKKIKTVSDLQLAILKIEEDAAIDSARKENYNEAQLQAIRESYALRRETLEVQTNSAIFDVKRLFESGEIDNLIDYYKTTFEIDEEEAKRRIKLAKWAQGELAKANAGVQDDMMADLAARGFDGKVDKPDKKKKELTPAEEQAELVKQAKKLANSLVDALNAQYDAEISIEEAKTARINNELKKRLNNEQLSAEQREKINGQIAANEEALQNKRDEIAERNFKLQKAVQIAQALMSTAEMAIDAYGTIKGMKFLGLAAPPLAAAAAVAASAFGLAQVDAIRRQQFVPSAVSTNSSSSSVGASSVAVQAPDFNIVGQSQTSQLAELVSGQLDRPVKAYVVSKDISTAQELDRNKIDTAAL